MAATEAPKLLADAVIGFSLDGLFPQDIDSLPPVSEVDLAPAINALDEKRVDLEREIHTINEETKGEVSSWISTARTLQEDIIRSKAIANDIVRQSEAPEVSGEAIHEIEEKTEFVNREVQYSQQLLGSLKSIRRANQTLANAEAAIENGRIVDCLHILEQSRTRFEEIGVSRSCRVMKLLQLRASNIQTRVHRGFDTAWKSLIHGDVTTGILSINTETHVEGAQLSLVDAVYGLQTFKEVEERMEQLWRNLDAAIVTPLMQRQSTQMPKLSLKGSTLALDGQKDDSLDSLYSDLEIVMGFLADRLPPELLHSVSAFLVADLAPRLIREWLNPAVPSSLVGMASFEGMIQRTQIFCQLMSDQGYDGFDELNEWAEKAPTVWLDKCREMALNTVRVRLTRGVGKSKQVEKVEKHTVSRSEGKELASKGAAATNDANEWGDDWGDEWAGGDDPVDDAPSQPSNDKPSKNNEDDGADAWGWDEDDSGDKSPEEVDKAPAGDGDDDDDDGAAWGWGDDDGDGDDDVREPEPKPKAQKGHSSDDRREIVLKETYHISSMPEPVLELIYAILEDGATLTTGSEDYAHIAATAPGLFTVPTFALALFRAISPHYYSLDVGGNMYLYNDAMYLSERLADFSTKWKANEDLTPRARSMLRLDNDIKSLQSFANRSYGSEMNVQKTVLRDLLGGAQSIFQQDEPEPAIEAGVARIRSMAATWESILARSVWSQAVGSLADALAAKLVTDILEMTSIGQDEAYNIAKLIAVATELDDLFLPSRLSGQPVENEVPTTAQYAPSWLRLKYLSEVLQSNLNEVRFLWVDSELSLYFTADEVIDLIRASFEDNARTRETIREVQTKKPQLG